VTGVVTVATWNVNSVKARLGHLLRWLETATPDVVLLQELKCGEESFPTVELTAAGYGAAVLGQKSYNGVAILSRHPIAVTRRNLPGPDDPQARYLEALIGPADGERLRVATLYAPNGNPVDSEKFPYKLAWLERLRAHAGDLLALEEAVVLGGDWNVCPTADDVHDPAGFADDALFRPESRARHRALLHDGWTDADRALHPDAPHRYTFWDYQAGAWQRDAGLRIDHLLLSPRAADRLQAADVDRTPRGWEKASDHTPVWCRLAAGPLQG